MLTIKATKLLQSNIYVFNVDKKLLCFLLYSKIFINLFLFCWFNLLKFFYFYDKSKIKVLIESVFGVQVLSINSYIYSSYFKRLGKFKGAKNIYKRVFIKLMCLLILNFKQPYFKE